LQVTGEYAVSRARRTFGSLNAAAGVLAAATTAFACGFEDPNSVGLARGVLNWAYPESLHVIGAISAATATKRLAHRATAADPFGAHYRATVKALEGFAELLGAGSGEAVPTPFSLVLIEPMLWTHFEAGPAGLRVQVHVSGPLPDQVVLVSGQDVIHAIANERLGIGEAISLGLIRSYGPQDKIAHFLRLARDVGRDAARRGTE
jgi:hypothetical protein